MTGASNGGKAVQRGRWLSSSRWLQIALAFVAIAAISWVFLSRTWPFTEQAVKKALQDRFARQVEIRSFRMTYLPPGCVVDGVSFLHRTRKDLPPLITVQSLIIRGSYAGLLGIHNIREAKCLFCT